MLKPTLDAGAMIAATGTLDHILTPFSTVIAAVYLCVRLSETQRCRQLFSWMKDKWRG